MKNIIAYLKLMRPANILTAIADILLGFAASGTMIKFLYDNDQWFQITGLNSLFWLIGSTIGLYGGGVVFNDVFDAEQDKLERPERPIPSGLASKTGATILGSLLLLAGIACAFMVSVISGAIAVTIAILALTYDKYNKHHEVWGPLNMGACRSANLMLGMSVLPAALLNLWFLAIIPVMYISAITLISRGEVSGISKKAIEAGLLLYIIMLLGIFNLGFLDRFRFWHSLPFILLFVLITIPSWVTALRTAAPMDIRKAVKTGVIALIILDASLAAGFAGIEYGLMILVLLPLSILIAKGFAVT
jgi:4-hydroxybenzoate polyprenyltransferase